MKHFKHSHPQVQLISPCPDMFGTEQLVGQVYDIIQVDTTCGGTSLGEALSPCKFGGDIFCPGRILLDRSPFNIEPQCYSWGGKGVFKFFQE